MENMEFKKWLQERIRTVLQPVFKEYGLKKGRTNCYIREKNNMVQYIRFEIRQYKAGVDGGFSPIFYPLYEMPYLGFKIPDHMELFYWDGIRISPPVYGVPLITPEAMAKWEKMEKIVIDIILHQFDEMPDLDELMAIAKFGVPDNDVWNGVRWYTQGVYQCRFGDFFHGVDLLKKAQGCKSGFMTHLKNMGYTFDIKNDRIALTFHYVDLLCDAVDGVAEADAYSAFLSVYEEICEDMRKLYKV